MNAGFQTVAGRMDNLQESLSRDDAKGMRGEQHETEALAAKTLPLADQTSGKVNDLMARVTALETRARSVPPTCRSPPSGSGMNSGYDSLGGPRGNQVIMGRFAQHASRAERKAQWEDIKRALPPHLVQQIKDIETPGLRSSIVLVTLHEDPTGPQSTRETMRNSCKVIKQAACTCKVGEEDRPSTHPHPRVLSSDKKMQQQHRRST